MQEKTSAPQATFEQMSDTLRMYANTIDRHPSWQYEERTEEFMHQHKPARIILGIRNQITAYMTIDKNCGSSPAEIANALNTVASNQEALLQRGLNGKFSIDEYLTSPGIYGASLEYEIPLTGIEDMETLLDTIESVELLKEK